MDTTTRTVELDDLSTRSEGGGRYIDAYAAVFDRSVEVRDWAGHYHERLAPTVFDKTLQERAGKFKAIFNHGRDLFGNPSEKFTMPYGVPEQVRADGRGLWTSTKVSDTPLGEEVYTLARDGALDAFSFRAGFIKSNDLGVGVDGLRTYERTEASLREFGPAVFPVYDDAVITAVRAATLVQHMTDEERAAFFAAVGATPPGADPAANEPDPVHSEPTSDAWRARALRDVLAFDIKG